jgi:hypothetical protein
MSKWRAEAIARLPEFAREINAAETIMAFWIELGVLTDYATCDPALMRRIHSFADWCKTAPRNDDPSRDPPTAVTVGFFEHLPNLKSVIGFLVTWSTVYPSP